MKVHKFIVVYSVACALPVIGDSVVEQGSFQDPAHGLHISIALQKHIYPRQTPIIVVPPSGSRTSHASQLTDTNSLNYWWPYGPNGVNPTATAIATFVSPTETPEMEETDIVEAISTDLMSSVSVTTPPLTTPRTYVSTELVTTSTKHVESSSDNSSKETEMAEPTTSGDNAFNTVSLLPLFIILGVLVAATLIGWAYGQCIRRCRRREPTPGGPDIGGEPYQGSGYDSDIVGPLHSLGVSWVDASRIHSRHNLGSGTYSAIGMDSTEGEPGTPSENKTNVRGGRNWFRYTLSGRKRTINSPSREKGLHAPLAYSTCDRQLPTSGPNRWNDGCSPYLSACSKSPKTLRIVNASLTPRSELFSPITSTQHTPFLSASRHASLRSEIVIKAKESDINDFTTASPLTNIFSGSEYDGGGYASFHAEDWAAFKGNPHKRSPSRRYMSASIHSRIPMGSPDPELHRERMHRPRVAGETVHGIKPVSNVTISPLSAGEAIHPLPPTLAVLLSPPLQPHLFFTRVSSESSECDSTSQVLVSKLDSTCGNPSRNQGKYPNEPDFDENDSFGSRAALNTANRGGRKGKASAYRRMGSAETLPLSPELRGAAMTKLDEIVKSHWSIRNLAELPQSPTLYGALGSPSAANPKGESHQASIGETLLTAPRAGHTRVE